MPADSDPGAVRCIGQRMLNPYRGVMHSVVTEWADAVTTDGRRWTLYVRGECLYDDLSDLEGIPVTIPDVKYGTWSLQHGFDRAPIRLPTFDDRVRWEGDRLLDAVRDHADRLPFALADCYELWLLDPRTRRPLALLASSCGSGDCETPAMLRWTPGQVCMSELPAARELNAVIAALAGAKPDTSWYRRASDGSGRPLPQAGQSATSATTRSRTDFAPLLVDRTALDEHGNRLLDAVENWQAPSLLQLPNLSAGQRAHFETAACRHAARLAEQLPLYPQVLNRAAITAALVEARLRAAAPTTPGGEEASSPLSPYYLEVGGD